MRLLKITVGLVVGIIGYQFISSFLKNERMDWVLIFNLSVAAFIGILIVLGLRNLFKKEKN